ncbi:MAG: HU family DNA-binding protein [Alistipes indistinctus]
MILNTSVLRRSILRFLPVFLFFQNNNFIFVLRPTDLKSQLPLKLYCIMNKSPTCGCHRQRGRHYQSGGEERYRRFYRCDWNSPFKSGDKLPLVGFGSFSVAKKPGRTGRNPRTGAAIKIAPKKVVNNSKRVQN